MVAHFRARMLGTIAVLTLLALPHAYGQTPIDYTGTIQSLGREIPALMAEQHVLGAAIALIDGQRIVWSDGFGFTDQSRTRKVEPGTLFSVQSISKTYTATAFMRLLSQGRFGLDDSLRKYLPDFVMQSRDGPEEANKITFRLLLSHRAGLPHEAPRGGNFDNCDCSFEDHVRSVFGSWLKAPVGQRYAYSNVGIDLVGYAMARTLRKPFAVVMEEVLLHPLGMTRTTFNHDQAVQATSFARGQIGGKDVPAFSLPIESAGGMYSTVLDMAKFVAFHIAHGRVNGRQLIPRRLLDTMYAIQAPTDHQLNGYGLGIERRRQFGRTVLTHGGGGFGYQSEQRWIPSEGIGVVVLTNFGDDGSVAVPIATRALALMLRDRLGQTPADIALPLTDAPVAHPDTTILRHLEGEYRGYNALRTFKIVEGQLHVVAGNNDQALVAHGPTEFTTPTERFRFRVDNGGRPMLIEYLGPNGTDMFFPNTAPNQPFGPNRSEWAPYIGTYIGYANGEPFESNIVLKNGYLYSTRAGGTRLVEYTPGLFFTTEGEAVIFEGARMSLGNRPFVKKTTTM